MTGIVASMVAAGELTPADLRRLTICIERSDGKPGHKDVIVNGELWGYFEPKYRGSHGRVYELLNLNRQWVKEEDDDRCPIRVWSDKYVAKDIGIHGIHARDVRVKQAIKDGKMKCLEDRMADAVMLAIKSGRMKSPAVCKTEMEERNRRYNEQQAALAAEKVAEFSAKAREAVGEALWTHLDARSRNALSDRIIAAMEWAQTR